MLVGALTGLLIPAGTITTILIGRPPVMPASPMWLQHVVPSTPAPLMPDTEARASKRVPGEWPIRTHRPNRGAPARTSPMRHRGKPLRRGPEGWPSPERRGQGTVVRRGPEPPASERPDPRLLPGSGQLSLERLRDHRIASGPAGTGMEAQRRRFSGEGLPRVRTRVHQRPAGSRHQP